MVGDDWVVNLETTRAEDIGTGATGSHPVRVGEAVFRGGRSRAGRARGARRRRRTAHDGDRQDTRLAPRSRCRGDAEVAGLV
jgi:hypothetical protein